MALSGTLNTSGYYDSSSPYYIQFTWTATQSIANNTSTVSWSAKIQGGVSSGYYNNLFSRWISVNGSVQGYGVPYDGNYPQTQVTNGYTVYSGTTTVNHNADGTGSFAVSIKANIEFSYPALNYYNTAGSTTFTLDSIPRAAEITSAPNFSDQDNPVLSYSNPAGSAATVSAAISLDGTSASIAYRSIPQTSGNYTFNLTTAERNTLRNATTSAQSRTVYFLLKSVIGSNTYTRSVAKTFTVADVAANRPEFTSHSIAVDNSAIPSAYRSNFNGMYIQNVSKATVSMAASAKYSATISGYSSTFNGKTYSGNSFTSDLITSAGSMTLSSTVTDSRGLKGTASKTISASSYATPYMTSVQAYRCDSGGTASDTGTYIKIQATRIFTSLNSVNHALIRYRTKEATASSWGSWVTILDRTASGTSVSTVVGAGGIDKTKAYDLQLSIVDDIGKETVQQLKIPTENITLHLKAGGKGLGFGTYATNDNAITFGFKSRYTSDGLSSFSGSPPFLVGIESFANGGELKWQTAASVSVGSATSATNATNIYAKSGSYKSVANTLLEMVYPVGSVYISTKNTSPATFLGGTWSQIKGRFLLGVGANTANTVTTYGTCAASTINRSTVKEQGGEVTHTLDVSEMPAHNHLRYVQVGASTGTYYGYPPASNNAGSASKQGGIQDTGGGGAHNNMPPYITVYMWERTA